MCCFRGPISPAVGCRHAPYPNLYPDQSPSEEWTMEERFRPLTFHGLILRSQLVNLLIRGVCYAENESVSPARPRSGGVTAAARLRTLLSRYRAPPSPDCRMAR